MPQGKSTSRDARSYTLAKLERAENPADDTPTPSTAAFSKARPTRFRSGLSRTAPDCGRIRDIHVGRFGTTLERAGSISPASLPEKPILSVNRAASPVYLPEWSGREG